MMNPKVIMNLLGRLAMLKYFPASSDAVMEGLMVLVGEMCRTEDEVRWLVTRMTTGGLYSEWRGPQEMRACFCSRFKPKDGINAYSQVYPDGLPLSREAVAGRLGAGETKALPPGASITADSGLEAALHVVSKVNTLTRGLGGPATAAEIAAAPHWLRKCEGLE